MRIRKENLWKMKAGPTMYVVTTNSTVTSSGLLVMGRGAAKQAQTRVRNVRRLAGTAVREAPNPKQYGFLEILSPKRHNKAGFGIFQVKEHFKDKASIKLIAHAVKCLRIYALQNPEVAIRMNFPGIGYGRLSREEVEPLLQGLPPNVTICYL